VKESSSSSAEQRTLGTVVRSITERYNLVTVLLAFSLFGTGACGLVTEYILATVSSYLLGSMIEQFSVIIALMMVMMGISTWIQKYVKYEKQIETFILVEVAIALLGGFAPLILYGAFSVLDTHFPLVQYFLVVSIGFLVGFEIPLVLRINEQYSKSLKANIAAVVSFDYIGAFLGAIVWAYILLRHFALTEISFIVAGLNFSIAITAFALFARRKMVRNPVRYMIIILLTGILLVIGIKNNRQWSVSFEQRLYSDNIVFTKTTRYQHLVMTHNRDLDEYRFYINGNLQFSSWDEHVYHEHLVHLPMHLTGNSDVAILGGGDFLAAREVLKYENVKSVTVVALDAGKTDFCSSNPVIMELSDSAAANAKMCIVESGAITPDTLVLSSPVYVETGQYDKSGDPVVAKVADVNVINMDADKFLDEIRGRRFNVVLMDFPDPCCLELGKLYTREFFTRLRRNVLSEHGVVVTQATSPVHAKEAYLNIMRTMQASGLKVIPYHDNVPSFGEWGWLLGWKSDISVEQMRERIDKIDSLKVHTKYLTPDVIRASLVFGKDDLESKYPDVINTRIRPTLHSMYIRECWKHE